MNDRVESIFHEARQLTGTEREAYLRGACGKDLALRSKVEALLQADEEAADFLKSAKLDPEPTIEHSRNDSVLSVEQPGQKLGRYKLLQKIGEGGFGSVWMAEQREPVKRRVALKIIKLGMDTKQVIARFEAERQALAMMDHPNIAKVLDAGSTDVGRPYFVMEYIKGVPILEYCDSKKLSPDERLALFIPVCQAVQHAHQKGIIHRDLKPSNVLVTLHDGVPVPKVIDFGIAKATSAELTNKTLFTEHRQMIGTPAYMSPEQAEMSGLDIDTRSDIYSLGVLLYELLTGITPFDNKSLLEVGYEQMMKIICDQEPLKPSDKLQTLGESATITAQQRHAEPGQLKSLLAGDMDWIVMKCLEKDRSRRYETANGLAADIQRHLNDEPVVAGPPSRRYKLRKFIKRNKAQVAAAGALTTALVLGVIGTSAGMVWAISEANRADAEAFRATRLARSEAEANATAQAKEQEAREQKEAAERELTRANEIKSLITQMLSSVDPATAQGMDTELLKVILDNAATRLSNGEITDDLISAELHSLVGKVYMSLGLYPEAEQHLPKAMEIYRGLLGDEDRKTLAATVQTARLYRLMSRDSIVIRLDEAKALAVKATERSTRVLGPEDPDTLAAIYEQAMIYKELPTRIADAEELLFKLLESSNRVFGAENQRTVDTMSSLGSFLLSQGKFAESEKFLQKVVEVAETDNGPNHPRTLEAKHALATLYAFSKLGGSANKFEMLQDVIEARKRVLGAGHPQTLESMQFLGQRYLYSKRFGDAEQIYQEVVDICAANSDANNPAAILAAFQVAALSGRTEDALKNLERYSIAKPADSRYILQLLSLQAWQGREADYQATARSVLDAVRGTNSARIADMTAKACCLLPTNDPALRADVLNLANTAVERGTGSNYLPFYQQTKGMAEYRRGDHTAAEQSLAAAAEGLKSKGYWYTTPLFYRAMSLFELGRVEDARLIFDDATTKLPPHPGKNQRYDDIISHNLIAWLAYKEAKALTGFEAGPAEPYQYPPEVRELLVQAEEHRQKNQKEQGLRLRQEALDIALKKLPIDDPGILELLWKVGEEYRQAGQHKQGIATLEPAVSTLRDEDKQLDDIAVIKVLGKLAELYLKAGQRDASIELQEEIVQLRHRVSGPTDPESLHASGVLAWLYHTTGRVDEGLELREKLLAIRQEVNGRRHRDTLNTMRNLAISYDKAGREDEALQLREQVLPLYREVFGTSHSDTLKVMNELASSYAKAGREQDAQNLREQAAETKAALEIEN